MSSKVLLSLNALFKRTYIHKLYKLFGIINSFLYAYHHDLNNVILLTFFLFVCKLTLNTTLSHRVISEVILCDMFLPFLIV